MCLLKLFKRAQRKLGPQLVKKLSICPCFLYNKGNRGVFMEQWDSIVEF